MAIYLEVKSYAPHDLFATRKIDILSSYAIPGPMIGSAKRGIGNSVSLRQAVEVNGMKSKLLYFGMVALLITALLPLAGCQKTKEDAGEAIEEAKEMATEAADAAGEMAEDAAEKAGEMMEEGKEAAEQAVEAGKEMTGEALEAAGEKIEETGEAMEEKGKELQDGEDGN